MFHYGKSASFLEKDLHFHDSVSIGNGYYVDYFEDPYDKNQKDALFTFNLFQ
jgi:hypothetical protein